ALQGEQFLVAPHVFGAQRDLLAADRLGDGLVVVIHLERPEVVGAEVERFLRVPLAAQAAFQAPDKVGWHVLPSQWLVGSGQGSPSPRAAARGLFLTDHCFPDCRDEETCEATRSYLSRPDRVGVSTSIPPGDRLLWLHRAYSLSHSG